MRHYDALVVGCGAMGSSASYHLAAKGLRVLTLDRFGLNHEFGSSHGRSRIIRLAYYEDERYVPLLRRAFESWRSLEKTSGKELLKLTGGLMIGSPEGELVKGVLNSSEKHGISHQLISAREMGERFESLSFDDGFSAVYLEDAGILFPEECIKAYAGSAREAGCELKFSEPVTSWKGTPEGVEVAAGGEVCVADRVVFCAGAWTRQLLGDVIPLSCERQVPLWFSSGGEKCFAPEEMPVFIAEETPENFFYGIPELGHGVKVARTHQGQKVEPDTVSRTVTDEDVAPVAGFISRRMRKLGRTPIASGTCIYTNTPDLNFAIGPHPDDSRITVVSACSGHGFKFASAIGEVAADLAVDGKTDLDISFLGIDRFRGRT
ncbi:MAG: N-methyl-L-tryptophan oxidase [Thaumarchaeota archaeon]|nr:N-methyl-L-tryptophan oxidase [Nitrososphaerota archaeon]